MSLYVKSSFFFVRETLHIWQMVMIFRLICYRFEKMGQNARKDLDSLKNAYKHGDPVPRFHYETRTFTLVQ